mgnify:CR=1 FL=1
MAENNVLILILLLMLVLNKMLWFMLTGNPFFLWKKIREFFKHKVNYWCHRHRNK